MPDDAFDDLLATALDSRRSNRLFRDRQIVRPIDSTHVEIDGVRYVNFCSNDYLGLTHHPKVIDSATRAMQSRGAGAGASPLISGFSELHQLAERSLARWKGTECALLLPSGYQANHAVVQAIAGIAESAGRKVRFLLDKLAHASLIDATLGSGSPFRVFPHNDMEKLERLLRDADASELQVVLTESIFSMDGDAAPLTDLAALKQKHRFTLVLDEAHASGVYGPDGSGYAAEMGLTGSVDVFVVTLSKAIGCVGGAVCASRSFCDAVVNFGRAYIYSTSAPAAVAAACAAAIAVMKEEPRRQQRVRELAVRVRTSLAVSQGDSPIIPIVLGDEGTATDAALALRSKGLLVLPIRPPTVPRGTSRLRVTLSCDHSDDEVSQLIAALRQACA